MADKRRHEKAAHCWGTSMGGQDIGSQPWEFPEGQQMSSFQNAACWTSWLSHQKQTQGTCSIGPGFLITSTPIPAPSSSSAAGSAWWVFLPKMRSEVFLERVSLGGKRDGHRHRSEASLAGCEMLSGSVPGGYQESLKESQGKSCTPRRPPQQRLGSHLLLDVWIALCSYFQQRCLGWCQLV